MGTSHVHWDVLFQAAGLGFLAFCLTLAFLKDVRGFTSLDIVFPIIVSAYVYVHNAILFTPKIAKDDGKVTLSRSPGLGTESSLRFLTGRSAVEVGNGCVVVVITYRTTGCEQSRNLFRQLVSTHKCFQDDVKFLAIVKEREEDIRTFLKNLPFSVPASFSISSDTDGDVIEKLNESQNVTSFPHSFVVNGKGLIEWHGHPKQLEPALTRIVQLAKDSVPVNGISPNDATK